MWDAVEAHAVDGTTAESYLGMLKRLGRTESEINTERQRHDDYWDEATELVRRFFGGAPSRVDAMVQRAMERMPLLYAQSSSTTR
jgi:hypothetical protein